MRGEEKFIFSQPVKPRVKILFHLLNFRKRVGIESRKDESRRAEKAGIHQAKPDR